MEKQDIIARRAELRQQLADMARYRNNRLAEEKNRHFSALNELHAHHRQVVSDIESEACETRQRILSEMDKLNVEEYAKEVEE